MTETCPKELVMPLEADKLPDVDNQLIVLFASAVLLEISVAVRVVELPL